MRTSRTGKFQLNVNLSDMFCATALEFGSWGLSCRSRCLQSTFFCFSNARSSSTTLVSDRPSLRQKDRISSMVRVFPKCASVGRGAIKWIKSKSGSLSGSWVRWRNSFGDGANLTKWGIPLSSSYSQSRISRQKSQKCRGKYSAMEWEPCSQRTYR